MSPPSFFLLKEDHQDNHESMQEMDILDMNVLDETENDNGIPAEDDELEAENLDEDTLLNEEHDNRGTEFEDEEKGPEVRKCSGNVSLNVKPLHVCFCLFKSSCFCVYSSDG